MSNKKEKTASKFRRIFFPSPAASFMAVSSTIVEDAITTRKILSKVFAVPEPDERVQALSDPKEKFTTAMFLAGRNESEIPVILKDMGNKFEIYAVLTIMSIFWMFTAPLLGLGGVSGFRLIDAIFPIGLSSFLAAKTFAFAVSHYRFRNKSMIPISDFLKDKTVWFPNNETQSMKNYSFFLLAAVSGVIMSILFPGSARAAGDLTSFTKFAGAEDLSLEWIRRLFPGMANLACPAGQTCAASSADILGAMSGAMNSILLGISSLIMAWHIIIGTVNTAHEGKVLGQKWHTAWAPIRVVMGFGLLVPIKGYCGIQFAVMMVILMGYNMANGIWNVYVDKALSGEMASVGTSSSPNMGLEAAKSILISETCVAVLDLHRQQLTRNGSLLGDLFLGNNSNRGMAASLAEAYLTPAIAGVAVPGIDGINGAKIWSYGSVCGNISTKPVIPPMTYNPETSPSAVTASANQGLGDMAVTNSNEAYANFITTRDKQISILIKAVRDSGVAKLVAEQTSPAGSTNTSSIGPTERAELLKDAQTKYKKIEDAAAAFDKAISDAGVIMMGVVNKSGTTALKARAQSLGWASAGALNSTLVRAVARSQELVGSASPAAQGPDLTAFNAGYMSTLPSDTQKRFQEAIGYLKQLLKDFSSRGSDPSQSVTLGADMQSRNAIAQLLKPVTDIITHQLTDRLGYINPVNPMQSIQELGNIMLTAAYLLLTGWTALNAVAFGASQSVLGLVGAAAGVGFVNGISSLFTVIMMSLFIGGTLHAYVLPMIPFLMWTYAIIAIVSMAAELVIAAPMAAFMHIRADGQELINQEQRSIYLMTFNALLRPTLLLFGLALSNLVMSIMANYLNKVYGSAVSATNGDTVIGVMGWLALTAMIFYLHYQIVIRSMHLITAVPSMVSELIGARDGGRGEEQESKTVFGAIANFTSKGVNSVAGSAAKAVSPGPKDSGGPNDDKRPEPSQKTAKAAETAPKPTENNKA